MKALFNKNTPQEFWRFTDEIPEAIWKRAISQAKPLLGINCESDDIEDVLELVLGEGQFGTGHWQLGSLKSLYYDIKPVLPRPLVRRARQFFQPSSKSSSPLSWPVEDRYVKFLWEIGRLILDLTGRPWLTFTPFWPSASRFALVLTHDIETGQGQDFVRKVIELEESLGFRSCFNFVPERYLIDKLLMEELKQRGFEVGVHGFNHDGKLFRSRNEFERRSKLINQHMKTFGAVGFRAELMLRNPEWMQELDMEYDLSFFDTDPFEPIPGGTMSIWPFQMGHFIELPYTLVQDFTLTNILGETTPRLWLQKVAFLRKYCGMALLNTHPDYLCNPAHFSIYDDFLRQMRQKVDYWHALPRDVALWWKKKVRSNIDNDLEDPKIGLRDAPMGVIRLVADGLKIDLPN